MVEIAKTEKVRMTFDFERNVPEQMSFAITCAAPLNAHAIAKAPQPLPTSNTVLWRKIDLLSRMYLQRHRFEALASLVR